MLDKNFWKVSEDTTFHNTNLRKKIKSKIPEL